MTDNSQAVLSDCVLCLHAIKICIKRLLACSSSVNAVFPVTQPCQLEPCDSIINRCHFDLTLERVMTLNSRAWHFKAVIAVLNVRAVDAPVSGEWINSLKVTVTFLSEIPGAVFPLSHISGGDRETSETLGNLAHLRSVYFVHEVIPLKFLGWGALVNHLEK